MSTSATTNTKQWGAFLVRTLATGVVVCGAAFVGVKLASADPGGPASPDSLTYAGVLRTASGAPFVGTTTLTFVFRKLGDGGVPTEICRTTTGTIEVPDGGAFTTTLPMDTTRCPRSLFDGSSVTYDVLQAGEGMPIATGVPVTPVPYARFADQAGVNNDCPAGYERANSPTFIEEMRLCQRKRADGAVYDEVVRVGTGATAFWIDRYEASIWPNPSRTDISLSLDDFPRTGQWSGRAYALSVPGFIPSAPTWFQANEACRASGKRLPSSDEWMAAGHGTRETPTGDGAGNTCFTASTATPPRPRLTGMGANCASSWGAQDMVGNVWEWTAEWESGVGDGGVRVTPWGSEYNGDGTENITSLAWPPTGSTPIAGLPSSVRRGGSVAEGPAAGLFAVSMLVAPSFWDRNTGFRCVIPR